MSGVFSLDISLDCNTTKCTIPLLLDVMPYNEAVFVTACEKHTVNITILPVPVAIDDRRLFGFKITDLHDDNLDHVIYYTTKNSNIQGNRTF